MPLQVTHRKAVSVIQLQSFSTESVPACRRVDYWNDITCAALTAQIAQPIDCRVFCGRMTYLESCGIRMLELNASGSTVTRAGVHVSMSAEPIYLVRLAIRGDVTAIQDRREVRLRSGDFTLCDTSRPYVVSFKQPSDLLIIRVSRQRLLQYVARPEAAAGVLMPGNSGLSGLASRHLRDLWSATSEFIEHRTASRMVEITMQLLASAYSAVPHAKADRSCLATAHRARALELIEQRLSDPTLTPSAIAEELRMTPGYLHRLFSQKSETVARYILRRRLEECAKALKDPLRATRSITAVAFGVGFNSLPHFSRVFRERFGVTPREFRNGLDNRNLASRTS